MDDDPDGSAVYLVAVVIVGWIGGTWPALATALGSFLVYDLLFTEPRFSLVVADPVELLNLVLVLIVALAVGRLAAVGRERATEADRRVTEATASFAISRLIATADSTASILPAVVERLTRDVPLDRAWVTLEASGNDRTIADSGTGPLPTSTVITTLIRTPGDAPARWVRAHGPTGHRDGTSAGARTGGTDPTGSRATALTTNDGERAASIVRVKLETAGMVMGSLWGSVRRSGTGLDTAGTRLVSLAADQIALALRRDRLRDDAVRAEVARRNDAFKSALVDSVSHDLRTPLASIRATAGNLADPAAEMTSAEVRTAAGSIDAEVERLDRLVRSVLDLSRIGSGTLGTDLRGPRRRRARGRGRHPGAADAPAAHAHGRRTRPSHRSSSSTRSSSTRRLANILDNIARHTPPATRVEIDRQPAGAR